ncbi:MAG: DUF4214 domain-containing protein [Lachnospiraceae bacterium]|nr:DUF4214 domain-containing protein [Lachnospiraceae bacterium]
MKKLKVLALITAVCMLLNTVTVFAGEDQTDGACEAYTEDDMLSDDAFSEEKDTEADAPETVQDDAEAEPEEVPADEDIKDTEDAAADGDAAEDSVGAEEDSVPEENVTDPEEDDAEADGEDAAVPEDPENAENTEDTEDTEDTEQDPAGDGETFEDTVSETEDNDEEILEEEDIITEEADEDMVTVEDEAKDGASNTQINAFVTRCYRLILGREPDDEGFSYWTEGIRSGKLKGADILTGFIFSKEYTNQSNSDDAFVRMLYKTVLNRDPDSAGLADWKQKLKYNFTRRYVLRGFTGSQEFKTLCESYGMTAGSITLSDTLDLNPKATIYVYDLFQAALSRAPGRTEHKANVTKLLSYGARYVITDLFRSTEYKNKNTSDEQFVQDVFQAALKREAESGAVNNRVTMLGNCLSRMYVLKGVLGSAEFVKKVGNAGVSAGTFPDQVLEYRDVYPKATEFIAKSYKNGLGRKPGVSEVNKRLEQLIDNKMPVANYLYAIYNSAEFKKKHTTNSDIVNTAYKLMLQRSATSSEITAQTAVLKTGRNKLFYYISDTREFYNKCAEYGFDADYVYRKTASESFAAENIIKAICSKNPCYVYDVNIVVKGLMLHSVGCAQPSAAYFANAWNSASYDRACVHAFIDANTGLVYQTLPWNHRGWHAGGSANNTHIGVEMCEPSSIRYVGGATFEVLDEDAARTSATIAYESAVGLFAMLCYEFDLNPLKDGVIISHNEGYYRGVASGHVDPEHLWTQLGLDFTMDGFRNDVNEYLKYFK